MAEAPPAAMTWTPEQLQLLADTRLPAAARIVGLILSLAGTDGVEFGRDDVRMFLGPSDPDSDDTIRRLFRHLESTKWVARTPGGRGHSDTFRVLGPQECGSMSGIRVGMGAALLDRVCPGAALNPDRVGTGAALSPPSSSPHPQPLPPPDAQGRARDGHGPAVHSMAEGAIADRSDLLDGCQSALHDYLVERVDYDRQGAYVWRLVTSLEGGDEWMWKDRTGRTLTEGRTAIIAAALNELLACDEVGKHFPDPPGGFGNLRSKVRYLVASALGVEQDARKATTTDAPRPRRPAHTTIGIDNQGSLD